MSIFPDANTIENRVEAAMYKGERMVKESTDIPPQPEVEIIASIAGSLSGILQLCTEITELRLEVAALRQQINGSDGKRPNG